MTRLEDNALLAALASEDRALLARIGSVVTLVQGSVLQAADEPVDAVYFPTSGMLSHVLATPAGETIEIGLLGRDGALPLPAVFLDGRAIGELSVQIGGEALCVSAAALRDAMATRPALAEKVGHFADGYLSLIARTAVCNARHPVEARLARWLLLASDVTGAERALPLTHEFLGQMLGVRRASVTVAAQRLREGGAITYGFRQITVADPEALAERACSCYGYMRRLLSP
jgi:CRP-like cAMP-binding protein